MTKHLTLLLFIGLAFWSCEDSESNEPESIVLSGLWEWRYYYDNEDLTGLRELNNQIGGH